MSRINPEIEYDRTCDKITLWWDDLTDSEQEDLAERLGVDENSWSWGDQSWSIVIKYWTENIETLS